LITLYGIKNCDTVKKARKWLEVNGIEHQFHDFRVDGLDSDAVSQWLGELGWEQLVNKRSTTWKQLDQKTRDAMDSQVAKKAIIEHPTLIKRPLLDIGHQRFTGFSDKTYQAIFNQHTL
jgi:arsenate reductase